MVSERVQIVLNELNKQFKTITTMKIYSDRVPINKKIELLKQLPVRIRGTASLVYDALEGHANDEYKVFASQETIAKEIGYTREHVNYIIGLLHQIGLIKKIRRGVNKTNEYILTMKQMMISILEEKTNIEKEEEKNKQAKKKKSSDNKDYSNNKKQSSFSDYGGQRSHISKELELALRGISDEDIEYD
jgi:hypothetical protein